MIFIILSIKRQIYPNNKTQKKNELFVQIDFYINISGWVIFKIEDLLNKYIRCENDL